VADFYIDNDVPLSLVDELAALGHRATHTRNLQAFRANDADQLLTAAQYAWTLVSHNKEDFHLLHHAWQVWSGAWGVAPAHAGILILPQVKAPDLARLLDQFARQHHFPLQNEMHEYNLTRGWERWP
jgi:hypothetical protein